MNAELSVNSPQWGRKATEVLKQNISREFRVAALVSIAHLPLGLVLYNAGPLAIIHPVIVFVFGLYLAVKRQVVLGNVVLVAGYIVGAEVLWRMAGIPIYWESGKYMSAAIMIIALLRRRRFRIPPVPVVYFVLLLPSCLLTIAGYDLSRGFPIISFTMSGPFLLLVSCWFFHNARLSPVEFKRLLMVIMLPLLSVALTTLFYTVSNEDLQFTGESNLATSGGFGPNQVSSMLGLGVFLSLAGLILFEKRPRFSIYFAVSALFMAALSVMTFSRGGIYNAIGAVLILILFQTRNVSTGLKRMTPLLILATIFVLVIFPYLNSFTGGALEERFEDTGTTNRWEIIEADIQVFLEDPLFGVGAGASREGRKRFLEFGAVSHTEFSRLLSEHGIFGLAALAAIAFLVFTNLRRPNSTPGKAFIAGAIAWSFFFMMNAGMRLAAPSFMLGLAFVTIGSVRTNFPPGAIKRNIQSLRRRIPVGKVSKSR